MSCRISKIGPLAAVNIGPMLVKVWDDNVLSKTFGLSECVHVLAKINDFIQFCNLFITSYHFFTLTYFILYSIMKVICPPSYIDFKLIS